jgi:hypothetical protein
MQRYVALRDIKFELSDGVTSALADRAVAINPSKQNTNIMVGPFGRCGIEILRGICHGVP